MKVGENMSPDPSYFNDKKVYMFGGMGFVFV